MNKRIKIKKMIYSDEIVIEPKKKKPNGLRKHIRRQKAKGIV